MSDTTTARTRKDGTLAGRPVNRIGYGAMQLEAVERRSGGREQAVNLLRRAVELGVEHIDTAQFYGNGLVNELIREALHPYPENLMLVSKVGAVNDDAGRFGLTPAQRPAELRADIEANLRSLGAERIDVVNLRRLDGGLGIRASGEQIVDMDSQLAELAALREEGKIGAIGLSNVSVDQVRQALPVDVACVQNYYTMLERSDEPVLAECRAHGVAWVPYCPLGSASLPGTASVPGHPAVIKAAEAVGALPAQIGLAWQLAQDPDVLLIPGTTNPDHLAQNVAAADIRLAPDTMATLDALGRV